MIVISKCAIKNYRNLPDFFNSSLICPHNFPFQTLSLYFLFDMSCNSSHLRTKSIDFSSIYWSKNRQHSLQVNTRSVMEETLDCSHYRNWAGADRSGPFRHVKHSHSATERNWDATETFLPVWTSREMNGDVPRRNENVAYSVNRPLHRF